MTLKVDFIVEYEIIFKTALGYESLDQVGSIREKNRVQKSCETIPVKLGSVTLNASIHITYVLFCFRRQDGRAYYVYCTFAQHWRYNL
jgi:hypothetical protein